MMNIINGGAHASNNLDFQEFMIIPNRETIKERPQIPQYNGFRTEWSNYITENLDNLYN